MLFNSVEFILFFLPIVFIVYFILIKTRNIVLSKIWLVLGSLFFYSWWNILYLPLILSSMLINFLLGVTLTKNNKYTKLKRKTILIVGIVFNISLLGYFKYADFLIENVNFLFNTNYSLLNLLLPLAISFFTFQQISYLVDSYKNSVKEYNILNYSLFVTFFPQLIAGPIVHHKEMMPQFESMKNKVINYKNISIGLFIFAIGLFKKVGIADTFSVWANYGFDQTTSLTLIEAWIVSLSYTFQLYFDFSGYTDMAIGAALLFNIRLPMNFFSPYKALNIQDFWRRWHITLSRFLRDYIYIPLGGNRKGLIITCANLMITFLIGGLWHGASWTFVFWGFLHGAALIIHRFWSKLNIKMNYILAWFITFNFINITWIFFRAEEWQDAIKVLKGMFGFNGLGFSAEIYSFNESLTNFTSFLTDNSQEFYYFAIILIVICFIFVLSLKNSMEFLDNFKPNTLHAMIFIFAISVVLLIGFMRNTNSDFLYFNF